MSELKDPRIDSIAKAAAKVTPNLWEAFVSLVKDGVLIDGKTLKFWSDYFAVKFPHTPDTISPAEIQTLLMKAGNLYQEVGDKIRRTKMYISKFREIHRGEISESVDGIIKEIREKHPTGKLPARAGLEEQAKSKKKEFQEALVFAESVLEFFESVEKSLDKTIRVLEQLNIANAHLVKVDKVTPKV